MVLLLGLGRELRWREVVECECGVVEYGGVLCLRELGIIPIGPRPRDGYDWYMVADGGAAGSRDVSK
jgi:hypothetical protein